MMMNWQQVWTIGQPYVAGIVRHLFTLAAGPLIAWGWLNAGQQDAFVSIMSGIALGAIGLAWSAMQKWGLREIPRLRAYVKRLEQDITDLKRAQPVMPAAPGAPASAAPKPAVQQGNGAAAARGAS